MQFIFVYYLKSQGFSPTLWDITSRKHRSFDETAVMHRIAGLLDFGHRPEV
jgi:hypothetical protein